MPFTSAMTATRRPRLWPCPSTRRSLLSLTAPNMERRFSISKSRETSTRGSGIPPTRVLEKRVAALEGGVGALSVSSGMAAIHYSIVNIAEMGNNIVSLPQLYGATYTLLSHVLPKQGIMGRFAASDSPDDVEKLIDENTRAVYCESVGNPAGNVADIEGLARVAHKHGVPLIVDNTVATPILLRPIEYGADVVLHSMTKFMGGHGTTLGGMIVDGGNFPWRDYAERFYMLNKPEPSYHGVVYTEQFGASAYVARCRTVCQRNTGATLAPLSGFLLLQGVETLALRVERHVENARKVAEFLRDHPRVRLGQLRRFSRQSSLRDGAEIPGLAAMFPADLWGERWL